VKTLKVNQSKTMKYLPKIFLSVAVLAFAVGSSELGENSFFYLGRPVGAISFVLFMIFQFLKNETALYDQEQQARMAALREPVKWPWPETSPATSQTRPTQVAAQSLA
jgi:hypothetical protein